MKKLFMLPAIAVSISFAACAQKMDASKVPAVVKTAFGQKYPGVIPQWEMEHGKYEAGFKKDGNAISVLLDASGNITETETGISIASLPSAVKQYVTDHYAGKKIKEGARITAANGTVTYEAEVAGRDLIFNANGEFLKEIKD